jgi:hypothetical protein
MMSKLASIVVRTPSLRHTVLFLVVGVVVRSAFLSPIVLAATRLGYCRVSVFASLHSIAW